MDPELHKIVLLYIAMILGAVVTIAGVVLFFLGATAGTSGVDVTLGKLKIKITKAGPGAIVALFGVLLVVLGLMFAPSRRTEETTSETADASVLDAWLANTQKLNGSERYADVIDKLVGKDAIGGDPVRKFRVEYLNVGHPQTLEALGSAIYGAGRYWPLVAAINKEKLSTWPANASTNVPSGTLIEIWRVSRYYGKTTKTILTIAGPDVHAGYERLLEATKSGKVFGKSTSFQELADSFKPQELSAAPLTSESAPSQAPCDPAQIGSSPIALTNFRRLRRECTPWQNWKRDQAETRVLPASWFDYQTRAKPRSEAICNPKGRLSGPRSAEGTRGMAICLSLRLSAQWCCY